MSASNWQPFFYSCSDWSRQVNLVSVCLCARKTKRGRGREKQSGGEKLIWFVRKDVFTNDVSMTSVCQRVGSELPMSGGMSDHGNPLRDDSGQTWRTVRPADKIQHLEIDESAPLEWRLAVERENVVQIKCNTHTHNLLLLSLQGLNGMVHFSASNPAKHNYLSVDL